MEKTTIYELKIIYSIPCCTNHNNNVILINQLLNYKYDFIYGNGNNLQILGIQQNTKYCTELIMLALN